MGDVACMRRSSKSKVRVLFSLAAIFFFSQQSFAAAPGLCFSTKSLEVRKQTKPIAKLQLSLDQRHALALKASSLVYKLGDLDTAKSGADFIDKHEAFYDAIPQGYEYSYYAADRTSGLKYIILSAKDPSLPWIFAFAGTETMKDWLSDINLGRAQLERAKDLIQIFIACEFMDEAKQPYSSHRWIITGHSLGGGLAQAFAYTIQRARINSKLAPLAMELVTFNGFGAATVVAEDGRPDGRVLQTLNAANYFVTGDPISSIGKHIGPIFELDLPAIGTLDILTQKTRHLLDAVREAAVKGVRVQFSLAREVTPPTSTVLTHLASFGQYLPLAPNLIADLMNARLTDLAALEEASQILMERRLCGKYDALTLRYLSELSENFLDDIKKITDVDVHNPDATKQGEARNALLGRLAQLHERLARRLKKLDADIQRRNKARRRAA